MEHVQTRGLPTAVPVMQDGPVQIAAKVCQNTETIIFFYIVWFIHVHVPIISQINCFGIFL